MYVHTSYFHGTYISLWIPSSVLDSDWAGRPLWETVCTHVHSQNKLEIHRFFRIPNFGINTTKYPKHP